MNTVTRTGCLRSARIFRVFSESEKILRPRPVPALPVARGEVVDADQQGGREQDPIAERRRAPAPHGAAPRLQGVSFFAEMETTVRNRKNAVADR